MREETKREFIADIETLSEYSDDELIQELDTNDSYILKFPCPEVGMTQLPAMIALDYLNALVAGEKLLKSCNHVAAKEEYRRGSSPSQYVCFECIPEKTKLKSLVSDLRWLWSFFTFGTGLQFMVESSHGVNLAGSLTTFSWLKSCCSELPPRVSLALTKSS